MNNLKAVILSSTALISPGLLQNVDANLIPENNTGFYYQVGGGDDVPIPAFYDESCIPLDASGKEHWCQRTLVSGMTCRLKMGYFSYKFS